MLQELRGRHKVLAAEPRGLRMAEQLAHHTAEEFHMLAELRKVELEVVLQVEAALELESRTV